MLFNKDSNSWTLPFLASIVVILIIINAILKYSHPQVLNNFKVVDTTKNWTTYTSMNFGFTIHLPSTVSETKMVDDKYNRAVSFSDGQGGLEIMLRRIPDETFDLKSYNYMDIKSDHKTSVGGKDAFVFVNSTNPKGNCDLSGCGNPYVTYVVQNKNNLYHISFYNRKKLSETDEKIIGSFEFK